MSERPYTPATLAARWSVSDRHVRRMLEAGELKGFRPGGKMWRIPANEVERYECQTTDSAGSKDDSSSLGTMTDEEVDTAFARRMRFLQEPSCGSSPANVTQFGSPRRN